MSKHTAGPWHVLPLQTTIPADAQEPGAFSIGNSADTDQATILCSRFPWPERADEMQANAWLMAAAPELLKALSRRVSDAEQRVFEDWLARTSPSGDVESVQDQWENSFEYSEFCDEWKVEHAAIAKATGASHADTD